MLIVFWISLSLLVYSYFVYPLLLKLLVKPKEIKLQALSEFPSVDIVIAAYNEESCIKARIENALQQNYQGELNILVASDGSKDKTGEIITSFTDPRVKAFNFPENRGKISVLNDLIAHSDAEYLVLTDANTDFNIDAVDILIRSFNDKVGAVSGELILETDAGNQNQDGLYWKYEQLLKKYESSLGGLLGANGAIYAIKRELYIPLSKDTVVDDFCIVMNIKKQGYQVLYNELAVATEEIAPSLKEEYGRRVRIGIGNYKAFMVNLWALSPLQGWFSLCYWSHKVLRWFAPHLMLVVFLSNLLLITTPIYLFLFIGQVLFYAIGYYGQRKIDNGKKVNGLVAIVTFFLSMNVALGQGFFKFLKGHKSGGWQRTARSGDTK
ncbi:glycosyltransferase family 2 protein [Thalassotalea piscium]|uniref:Cellulose synthase/poly-beta-1,6-N-acetylglucosamine synthase-like glycosyltransferase n=1 Tax=Thalassotalea piscium TaxID=1230533 RepID=A0A7X0TSC6_9GAMM|nr:glycosyltransferase family 2 protein [Thalassotalea piscium]MBB6541935.1 cellulose synthase/poly-beta-1,6-N-acetylglucosamine synthase-like glycosyltransferase [Thalassotalea piscium]